MAGSKGSKAKGRRSSKDKNYYAAVKFRTIANKARRAKRAARIALKRAEPERVARLRAARVARRLAKTVKHRKKDKPAPQNPEQATAISSAIAEVNLGAL